MLLNATGQQRVDALRWWPPRARVHAANPVAAGANGVLSLTRSTTADATAAATACTGLMLAGLAALARMVG